MEKRTNNKDLRHDRHTVSLLTDHMVFAPKYRGKILVGDVAMITEGVLLQKGLKEGQAEYSEKNFPHLKKWCNEHMWAPSCFHGSVGNGWDVVSKYIETQDVHHAKNSSYRPRT